MQCRIASEEAGCSLMPSSSSSGASAAPSRFLPSAFCLLPSFRLPRDAQKLLKQLARLPRAERVDTQTPTAARIESAVISKTPRPHEQKEVRLVLGTKGFFARLVHLTAFATHEQVAGLGQRRQQRHRADATTLAGREQHPGVAWMHRKRQHLPTDRG